jgi:hypothetical protein
MQDLILPLLLALVVAFTIWGCASGPKREDEAQDRRADAADPKRARAPLRGPATPNVRR